MSENNNELQREINAFWGDRKSMELQLSSEREKYARMIINGLGEDLIKSIETPPKQSKWRLFKNKIKRLFKKEKPRY